MENKTAYRNLNFSLPKRRIPHRILTVAIAFVSFTLLWWVIPASIAYWLFATIFLVLAWMASYGWRTAVSHLVKFLQFIERL
jgi:uncharacterized RDD family membrane protein YckC